MRHFGAKMRLKKGGKKVKFLKLKSFTLTLALSV